MLLSRVLPRRRVGARSRPRLSAASSSDSGTAESTKRGAPLERRFGGRGGGSGSFRMTSGNGGEPPSTAPSRVKNAALPSPCASPPRGPGGGAGGRAGSCWPGSSRRHPPIWDAHARLGQRTSESGHSRPERPGDPRIGTLMPAGDCRQPAIVEPRCRGGPDRSRSPTRRRGKSRDSRMLDWDASARLTPLPAWRHVSRAPAPSPPRSRHCAAAGSPSRVT